MRSRKKVEKEIQVSISEVTTIQPVYYDAEGKEIKNAYTGWGSSGITYASIKYKKVKKFRVDSYKFYTNGDVSTLLTSLFETKEEAEETYSQLLEMNGNTFIENVIDTKTFKK